jgi:hypothetical protein
MDEYPKAIYNPKNKDDSRKVNSKAEEDAVKKEWASAPPTPKPPTP